MNNNTISSVKKTLYTGPGIPPPPIQNRDSLIVKLTHFIFHGGKLSLDLLQKRLMKAIFIEPDSSLLRDFQNQLQVELEFLASLPTTNESELLIWKIFLGNVLSILPFSYPTNGQLIKIPILIDHQCEMVEYQIEVLLLDEPDALSPLIALGLTPTHQQTSAHPILSYLGTTYPTGSGFLASIMTDFHPKYSVGEYTYLCAKPIIDSWLKDKRNVHVVGTSLGGALAFHTLKDHYKDLSRIDVYNPAGLYPESWKMEFNEGCQVNIYNQPLDIVPMMGSWPKGKKVSLYHIAPVMNLPSTNFMTAHIRAHSGCPDIVITQEDPAQENEQFTRKFLTFLHRYLGPILIYYPCKLMRTLYKIYLFIKKKICSFF